MSIILDALRRGSGERAPAPARAAQTDAVLQTLGGSRPADGRNPLVRTLWLVSAGIALAIMLALAVVWLM